MSKNFTSFNSISNLGLLYTVWTSFCVFPLSSHIILSTPSWGVFYPCEKKEWSSLSPNMLTLMEIFSIVGGNNLFNRSLSLRLDADGFPSLMELLSGRLRVSSNLLGSKWRDAKFHCHDASTSSPLLLPLPPPVFHQRKAALESPSWSATPANELGGAAQQAAKIEAASDGRVYKLVRSPLRPAPDKGFITFIYQTGLPKWNQGDDTGRKCAWQFVKWFVSGDA